MSGKKTFIIFIILAALGGLYALNVKRLDTKAVKEEAESRLVPPAKAQISSLTIKVGSQATALKKSGSDWNMTAPVAFRADRPTVDQILDQIDTSKKKDAFDVTDAKLDEYGLKSPLITADVTGDMPNGGAQITEKISLGADTPDNSETYARIGTELKVFTVPNSLKSQLNKSPMDLRDKRAVPALANQATSLILQWSTNTLHVAKYGGNWMLQAPAAGKADQAKVTEVLNEINNAKRSDFIDSATLNLASYGLDQPVWTAKLFVDGYDPRTSETLRTLSVGKPLPSDPTKVYARLEGDPGVFALNQEILTKGKPSLDDLRDKSIFSITAADVGKANFRVLGKDLALTRDSAGQWHFADDSQTRLDQAVITTKISTLVNLKAKGFLATPAPDDKSGLDKPNLLVTLSNKTGTTTESLMTGRKSDTEDIVYGRIPATGQNITVDWKDPGQFFLTREELVDKSLFNFSEDAVQKVSITDSSKTLILVKGASGAWTSQGGSVSITVDGPKMTSLLYGLTALQWARTLDPKNQSDIVLIKTQKLEHPSRYIKVYDSAGKELARLGMGGEELKYAYVTRGENEYFAIDKARLTSVTDPLNSITGGKGQTAPKPS